jgi:ketosteroid isomerase-like protein
VADNAELIRDLYEAMNRHDGDAMAKLYAPDGRFHDPAFGELSGAEAGDMWRMLTGRADDLSVELAEHSAEGDTGTAHWIARYTFGRTGREVTNDIRARFRFADGLIAEHDDEFSFHRWARQALGPPGLLLGWTPMLRRKVSHRARAGLDAFMAREDQSSSA